MFEVKPTFSSLQQRKILKARKRLKQLEKNFFYDTMESNMFAFQVKPTSQTISRKILKARRPLKQHNEKNFFYDTNDYSFPLEEPSSFDKFKYVDRQPIRKSFNLTASKKAKDSDKNNKSNSLFDESLKCRFGVVQPIEKFNPTISESAKDSNNHKKSILPFGESQKSKLEILRTNCYKPFPESSNSEPFNKSYVINSNKSQNLERFQPETNSSSTVSKSERKLRVSSILPSDKYQKLLVQKSNFNVKSIVKILYLENLLCMQYVSTYFKSGDRSFLWESRPKLLKKVVEIHNGRRFVRMEHLVKFDKSPASLTLQQKTSNTCLQNTIDSNCRKNNSVEEYANNKSLMNFKDRDKFTETLQSNRISNTKVSPNETQQLCLVLKDFPLSYSLESASNEFKYESENVFDVHQSPSMHQIKDVNLKKFDELNSQLCYGTNLNKEVWENDVLESSVADVKQSFYNSLTPNTCVNQTVSDDIMSLNDDDCESDDDYFPITNNIYDEIRHLKRILEDLERNSEMIRKELISPSLNFSEEHPIVPKANFDPISFINTYGNKSFEKRQNLKYVGSLANQHSKQKALTLPSKSTLLLLDSILLRLQNTYQNVQKEVYGWLNDHEKCKTRNQVFGNPSRIEDNCLAKARKCLMKYSDRRINTSKGKYHERFLNSSGLEDHANDDEINLKTGKSASDRYNYNFLNSDISYSAYYGKYYKITCSLSSSDSEEVESQEENEIEKNKILESSKINLSKNNKYIMKFKGRHTSKAKYHDSSSDSDDLPSQFENESNSQSERASPVEDCAYLSKAENMGISMENCCSTMEIPSSCESNEPSVKKEDESELDGSESSLDGSFKHFRTSSRLSPNSSGDDSDDSSAENFPRFSLPPPKSNVNRFYSKKTEIFNEASCKEWSLKKGDTEIRLKCTQKGTRFCSEERCVRDEPGIPEEFLRDDIGIPVDFSQNIKKFTTLSNYTSDFKEN